MPIIDGKAVSVACNDSFKKMSIKSLLYQCAPITKIEWLHRRLNPDSVFSFRCSGQRILMFLPYTDCIQSNIIVKRGFYESSCLKRMKPYVYPGSVVLDIGANIGNHTVFFGKICNAWKIYSFEPQLDISDILMRNVELNDLQYNVTICKFGLGSESCNASIIFDGKQLNNTGCTMIGPDEYGSLKIIKLDDMNIPEKVDFIKIDVEEMEYDVLCGASELIKRDQPVICIEILNDNYTQVTDKLNELGYVLDSGIGELVYIFKPK